jgi:hypothetical protein
MTSRIAKVVFGLILLAVITTVAVQLWPKYGLCLANSRQHTIEAVRAEIGEEDIPPLVRLMGHDRPAVRMAAGHLLLSMGEPALEALREAAGSADWHTRYVAQDALMTLEIRQHSDD